MASSPGPSVASCPSPRVIGPAYSAQGEFVEVDGIKVYCSGPGNAASALFIIYDIFGYSSQVLQGADFLASLGYKVFVPDFFHGRPAPLSYMPIPDSRGREPQFNRLGIKEFMSGPGETERAADLVIRLRDAFQWLSPDTERWGLVGHSWGALVANHVLHANSPFATAVQVSGFPSEELAASIARPLLVLCSKDETVSEYAHIRPHLRVEARFSHFPGMVHGWLSARGNLSRYEVQQDFQRGYEMLGHWFAQHL